MITEAFVNFILQKIFSANGTVKLSQNKIIVKILDIVMIRNVPANSRIPWFSNIIALRRITFFFRSAINRLLDDFPAKIMVRNFPLEKRSRCRYCSHNRCKRYKHVVKISSMVDVLGLICKLKAATAHPEMHCVHINFTRIRLALCGVHTCVLINKYRNLNINFFLTTFTNGLS